MPLLQPRLRAYIERNFLEKVRILGPTVLLALRLDFSGTRNYAFRGFIHLLTRGPVPIVQADNSALQVFEGGDFPQNGRINSLFC